MLKIVENKTVKEDTYEEELETSMKEEDSSEEDDLDIGIYFVHLITGERIVCTFFLDEDETDFCYCCDAMQVIEELDEDSIQLKLMPFNPFLKNNLMRVNSAHIIYYGEVNEDITAFYEEIVMTMKKEKEENKRTLVLKKEGNVAFGNFSKTHPQTTTTSADNDDDNESTEK